MFCRFCGAHIPADSRFCLKCGKRLVADEAPARGWVRWLKTPYPWAGLLFLVFAAWALVPGPAPPDPSVLALALELEAESSLPEDSLFRHHLSLVVENRGVEPVSDLPVELRASVTPDQPVEVVSEFRGGRFVVLRDGESHPLILVLADEIAASQKRRFPIDSTVTTQAPAEVTYSILREDTGEVLATLTAPIGAPSGDPIAGLAPSSWSGAP